MLTKLFFIGVGIVLAATIGGGGVSASDEFGLDDYYACLDETNTDGSWKYTLEECYEKLTRTFSFDNPRVGEQVDVNLHDGSSVNVTGTVTLTSTDIAQANCNMTGNGCAIFDAMVPQWMKDANPGVYPD